MLKLLRKMESGLAVGLLALGIGCHNPEKNSDSEKSFLDRFYVGVESPPNKNGISGGIRLGLNFIEADKKYDQIKIDSPSPSFFAGLVLRYRF